MHTVTDINEGLVNRQVSAVVEICTNGQGFFEITAEIKKWIHGKHFIDGLLTVFCGHTSASLTIQENADPDVQQDLLEALNRLAPRRDSYRHHYEGPDDMPAHIRTVLTGSSLSVPVSCGKLTLGTWQGVYLIEHRDATHRRNIILQFIGC